MKMTISKIDFEENFNNLHEEFFGKQKKIMVNSALKVFYGITTENYLRISFMSTIKPLIIDSTKELRVSIGQESENVYWTCFDLLNQNGAKVFYAFCNDLVDSIIDVYDENEALLQIKNRYHSWKSMFKNKRKMSTETIQGLYGELYFMNFKLFEMYDIDLVVSSWAGPNGYSKDFSIGNTWYEVKTPLASAQSIKISSISQLSSVTAGNLVVVKVDKMSESFEDGCSDIYDLFKIIMGRIKSNETKEKFIEKLLKYGFDINENSNREKYKFIECAVYNVGNNFPRLLDSDIKYQEIGKVTYELILNTLDKYKKEL